MPSFMGNRVTQRGGAGAGRGDDAHGVTQSPQAGGTQGFRIHGNSGGGYIYAHPEEGGTHTVQQFDNDHKMTYEAKGTTFSHEGDDMTGGTARWSGGKGGLGGNGSIPTAGRFA